MYNSDDDPLRPRHFLSFQVSTRSRSTWHALLSSARSLTHLPYCCSNIKSLLNQTPSIPASAEVIENIGGASLSLEGCSTWTVSSNDKALNHTCELPPINKTLSRKVYIGESRPGTCNLSDDYFSEWPGFQPLPKPSSNYLSVFVLGWSYVLSARLIELRRTTTKDKVVYTDDIAQWNPGHDNHTGEHFELDIGCDEIAEVRWWAAILAGGRGWQATLARGGEIYFSPWECHLNSSPFRICHHAKLPSSVSNLEPPSSAEAQEYLLNLARRHDAFDQLVCALAATMTLPMHNRFGASITLPKPIRRYGSRQHTELIYSDQIPTSTEVSQYMAFSGTSGLLGSCLFGAFWERGIPCNLASQWLDPAMKEIASTLFQSKQPFPVIWAMSERRPSLASLWLGATITGLLPRIFQVSRSFLPTIYLEAVTWTTSPQSFMDPPNYRHVKTRRIGDRDMISREDEFRLLFLTDTLSDTYGNPPLSPYPPFGMVDVRHTSLQVRLHLSCNHRLVYRSWDWQCQSGQVLSEFGTPNESQPFKMAFRANSLLAIWMVTGITCASLFKKSIWTVSLRKWVSITLCLLYLPIEDTAFG